MGTHGQDGAAGHEEEVERLLCPAGRFLPCAQFRPVVASVVAGHGDGSAGRA